MHIGRKKSLSSGGLGVAALAGVGLLVQATLVQAGAGVDWPAYNNDYMGQRYQRLKQINTRNVAELKEVCRVQLQEGGPFQTGPVVIDGVMYVTTARLTFALDAATCKEKWRHAYESAREDVWPVNRGVAVINGRVIRGTPDGHLLALDAQSGALIWQNMVGDSLLGEFLSGAPIGWNGLVFTATAGSDWGVRGRVLAFDVLTGREVWRFDTIPTGDQPGAETWQNKKSALTGGGGSWSTLSLDITTGELFVPVGNPAPDMFPDYRPGDNLYTDSLVVLDARTGALKWYHQVKANDGIDHDLGAAPTLFRSPDIHDIVVFGGKDGFVTAIDRATRKPIYRVPVTTIDNVAARPTDAGVHVCPGLLGGVEWNGGSYDPVNGAIYFGAVDWCGTFKKGDAKYVAGEFFFGGEPTLDPPDQAAGWVTSLNAVSGEVKWKYKAAKPVVSGITSTSGGVVFGGDTGGNFFALDSQTGKPLYTLATQGMIAGGVVTYQAGGKQYVALTSGNVSRITFGELGNPTLIVLGLPN